MIETKDELQIKIEEANKKLPEDTLKAISAVNWKMILLEMKEKGIYTLEQLADLEIETELVLCGLLSPSDYPNEVQRSLGIPKSQADKLVNEINDSVFKKIREEMMKITNRRKMAATKPAQSTPINPILAQKFTSSFKIPTAKTEYSLNNISKATERNEPPAKILEIQALEIELGSHLNPTPAQNSSGPIPQFANSPTQSIPKPSPELTTSSTQVPATAAIPKPKPVVSYPPKGDPYRLSPDE